MFNWFKRDPETKIRNAYHTKLGDALFAQRNGKIREYASLTAEAEALRLELEELQNNSDRAAA